MLFIVNLHAGKEKVNQELGHIIDLFVKNQFEVTIYTTQCASDATNKVKESAHDYDLVVCSGGDGTLNEVVKGMMTFPSELRVPIGYIPSGTTNDFANSLQLPRNMEEAARIAVTGSPCVIDIGLFNQKSFLYVAAFGIFTEVSYSTPQETKNYLGRMAYILEGIKSLANIKTYHLSLNADEELIEGDFIFGQITNSTSVGGFQIRNPQYVELNDGVFEMVLVRRPNNLLDLQNIVGAILLQDFNSEWFVYRKVKKVNLVSDEEVPWTLDGEFGGHEQEVFVENIHEAISVIVKKMN